MVDRPVIDPVDEFEVEITPARSRDIAQSGRYFGNGAGFFGADQSHVLIPLFASAAPKRWLVVMMVRPSGRGDRRMSIWREYLDFRLAEAKRQARNSSFRETLCGGKRALETKEKVPCEKPCCS